MFAPNVKTRTKIKFIFINSIPIPQTAKPIDSTFVLQTNFEAKIETKKANKLIPDSKFLSFTIDPIKIPSKNYPII